MADTGFLTSGTIASGGSGPTAWTNPNNSATSDNSYAVQSIFTPTFANTATLTLTNFGASVPSGATIDGIEITIERNAATAGRIKDLQVQLVKGGSASGTDKADTSTTYGTTDSTITYGGASDLWGNTLTQSDVNATNFGIVFRATTNSSTITACNVDAIRLKIYYTASGGTTYNLDAVSKTVTMTKNAASLTVTRSLNATSKSLGFNKGTASLNISHAMNAVSRALDFTPNVADLTVVPAGNVVYSLNAVSKSIDFTPNIASFGVVRRLDAVSKTLSITKNTATFQRLYNLNAVSKALTLSKGQSSLTVTRRLNPLSKSLTFTRNPAGLTVTRRLSAVSKTLSFSRSTASLSIIRRLSAVNKSLSFTRNMATLTVVRVGGTTYSLNAVSKALSFNQNQALLTVTRSMNAVSRTLIFNAHEAVFTLDLYNHEQEVCREVFDVVTATGICNEALSMAKAFNQIMSLTDDTTEARACYVFYNRTRQELMQAVPWRFLRVQRSLALLGAASGTDENPDGTADLSEEGWKYTYAYPCDCLEPIMIKPSTDGVLAAEWSNTGDMRDGQNSIVPWVQGTWANPSGGYKRIISTNKQNAILIYLADIPDTSIFPSDFTSLFVVALAAKLTDNIQLSQSLAQQAATMLQNLRAKYSLEYNTDRKPLVYDPVSEFISVRG